MSFEGTVYIDGYQADGTHWVVRNTIDSPYGAEVLRNGVPQVLEATRVYRDGGTIRFYLEEGTVLKRGRWQNFKLKTRYPNSIARRGSSRGEELFSVPPDREPHDPTCECEECVTL